MKRLFAVFAVLAVLSPASLAARPAHNLVIFVPDGLRYDSVTPETGPTFLKIRREGVDFTNSHSVYPTLTTVNASVIATGHLPGDTGDYGNTLYFGTSIPCAGGAAVTFLENDCILRDVKAKFPRDYLAQTTLIEAARRAGMNTVIVGKQGPAAIQFLPALDAKNEGVEDPLGIFIDDATGRKTGPDGLPAKSTGLGGVIAGEAFAATGTNAVPFASVPNETQQAYERAVVSQVLIPRLKQSGKPFVLLFWSRDPDTTQHGAMDSEGRLVPGINAITPHQGIYNADTCLKNILDALKLNGLADTTDVIVAADHGFSTIGHAIPTADGATEGLPLPVGFLAFDVAKWLGGNLYDPARANARIDPANGEHPQDGSALVGPSPDAPKAVVVANGTADFIHLADGPQKRATAKMLIAKLIDAPYTGALFVNDKLIQDRPEDFAGALPMSEIGLIGSSKMPNPDIVVGFRTFDAKGCTLGTLLCAVEISDTGLHTGQGMHGSLGRADTRNFMAAMGPDFKAGVRIATPVGNADVAPTAAHLLGLSLAGPGRLKGRVVGEALKGGTSPKVTERTVAGPKAANGFATVLKVQEVGTVRYIDAGGIPGRMIGLPEK